MSAASMLGGTALLAAAAIGAGTATQAFSPAADQHRVADPASHLDGHYVATLPDASVGARDATQVSRSSSRPALDSHTTAVKTQAEQKALARQEKLATAADSAASYADELKTQAEQKALARQEKLATAADSSANFAGELQSDEWVLPTSGFHITVWFGEPGPYWSSGYHTGIDFATAEGTPVVAVGSATVAQAGWDGPYGNQIRLQFENGDQVWYNHLSAIEVVEGDSVTKGQELGRVGQTGNAYGAHLHFEYRLASDLSAGVDPKPFFADHGIAL
ncbi:MAG: M23 family metallopeptidase [Nocardioidaceae bacterium]